jgi:hypothetical protein
LPEEVILGSIWFNIHPNCIYLNPRFVFECASQRVAMQWPYCGQRWYQFGLMCGSHGIQTSTPSNNNNTNIAFKGGGTLTMGHLWVPKGLHMGQWGPVVDIHIYLPPTSSCMAASTLAQAARSTESENDELSVPASSSRSDSLGEVTACFGHEPHSESSDGTGVSASTLMSPRGTACHHHHQPK